MVVRECLDCKQPTVMYYCNECAGKRTRRKKPLWLRMWQKIKYSYKLRFFCGLFICPIFKHDWDDGNYEPYPSIYKRCGEPDC